MDLSNFLLSRLSALGLTREDVGRSLGYRDGTMVSFIINGRRTLPPNKVEEIAEILQVDPIELLDLLPNDERYRFVRDKVMMERIHLNPQSNVEYAGSWGSKMKRLPVYEVGASWDMLQQSEAVEMAFVGDIVECSKDAFLAIIRGNSMEPELLEGDRILVDPEKSWQHGKICVLVYHKQDDGDGALATVKRVFKMKDGNLRLVAENREYAEQIINPNELDNLQILPVIQLMRYMR